MLHELVGKLQQFAELGFLSRPAAQLYDLFGVTVRVYSVRWQTLTHPPQMRCLGLTSL